MQALENGDRLWGGAALAAQIRFHIADRIFVEVGGETLVPVERRRFQVLGSPGPVFEQSVVCAAAFAGLGASTSRTFFRRCFSSSTDA